MRRIYTALSAVLTLCAWAYTAENTASRPLVDFTSPAGLQIGPSENSEAQVTCAVTDGPHGKGLDIMVKAGKYGYPGASIKPAKPWDLSQAGYVEASVTNTGTEPIWVVLQLANSDINVYSAAGVRLTAGVTQSVRTYIGNAWGKKISGFDATNIPMMLVYIGKTATDKPFRVESITVGGAAGEQPPVDPNSIVTRPENGVMVGPQVKLDAKQVAASGGAKVDSSDGQTAVEVKFTGAKQWVMIKPVMGVWNLNAQLEVRVKLKNIGATPTTPSVRLESRKGPSDTITAAAPIAPGAEAEIVVPFAARVPWQGVNDPGMFDLKVKKEYLDKQPGTGTDYQSHITSGVSILADANAGSAKLLVTSVLADMPAQPQRPAWLGQRPPVDGEWTKTFDDNFTGNSIDLTKWNVYAPNYGSQRMHFTKDNVIVKDGTLTLRLEKKHGFHNDDPKEKESDYATGWLDTYGKWVQRYGYFEARMKLPTAPSSWPAFWLMPDRGLKAGPEWERSSTKNGGMEFDIMETLSIWGVARHDFGMHWDSYGVSHKSHGMFTAYVQPDKEGFITVGMLWTPGLVVLYDNGRETARWECPRVSTIQSHLILDNVLGGWEAEAVDDAKFPADFVVSYVRVWQRKDLASAVDGPIPNKATLGRPTE